MPALRFGSAMLAIAGPALAAAAAGPWVYEAEAARLNAARAEVVAQASFRGQRGVSLRAGVASATAATGGEPDLVFTVTVPRAGRYSLSTHAATDAAGAEQMRQARSKFESLFARFQIGAERPTRRVVFVPWADPATCTQHTGNFTLADGPQEIRVWLPAGVRLDRLEVRPYAPPAVPPEAVAYQPPIVPPPRHPRLWVDSDSLARIRAHLGHPEHRPYWDRVRALAAQPFAFAPAPEADVASNPPLEEAALAKAFVHLVQDDARAGRAAVDLMLAYLPRVEFGNLLDITREIGAAIYAAACVYDWCHGLLAPAERDLLRRHLLRLAEEMESGWPPFRTGIVNGHGNEAIVNRDLLSLAIAVHDEDPVPYQYCAYAVLEQLVPMRRFEYQSPRHNQGVSYAAFRFGWEMHAAWLFRRMSGREVFDENLKRVPLYWLYFRLPDGEMLRDGDGVPGGRYWSYAQTALLCYAYNRDPVLKGEFLRQGGLPRHPILFLLLNDPALRAEPSPAALPLTLDFGPVLGGMVARTGWTMGPASPDVIAEVKGGGQHFGNHQHADAGSFQIYYRGLQVAKLAQYKFYGTPYDLNFAKRSIAQSMIRVVDPAEKVHGGAAHDGGARFVQTHPRTPRQAQTDPTFQNGRVLACSFGPSPQAPAFSYFAADLRSAYSEKLTAYVRRFCFLNLGLPGHPAAIIVLDDLATARPELPKLWQLTTLRPPASTADGVRLWNEAGGVRGHLDVAWLRPAAADRTVEIISGPEVHRVDGTLLTPPSPEAPEANGHRIVLSPRTARAHDAFLTVLQAHDDAPLPVAHEETDAAFVVRLADRVVVLPKGTELCGRALTVDVPAADEVRQVLITGLQARTWRVAGAGGAAQAFAVEPGRHTLFLTTRGGRLELDPVAAP